MKNTRSFRTSYQENGNTIHIEATHIVLPSGNQLALDALQSFYPNQEFWSLWKADKLAVKRIGIVVKLEKGGYRAYVRPGEASYSQSDRHKLWVEKAQELADSNQQIPPIELSIEELPSHVHKLPCDLHWKYKMVAKACRNGTFQLRLRCEDCQLQTPNAIAWETFKPNIVIRAIARSLRQQSEATEHSLDNKLH